LNKWLAGFQAGVDAARDHLNEVEATVEVRLTETSALIDSIEERIGESLAAVEERAKTVGGQFDVAVQKASEAWKEVAGRAEDQIAESVSRLESELSAPLNVLARSVDEATEKLIDGVRGEWSPEALREVTQAVLAPLVAELEKAIDTLCEGIEGLCGSARDSGRQGDATRAELDNAVDTIKAAIDPLMNELQRLRDLAGSVGISI
jgi:chromosome segregation ATPase